MSIQSNCRGVYSVWQYINSTFHFGGFVEIEINKLNIQQDIDYPSYKQKAQNKDYLSNFIIYWIKINRLFDEF